MNMTMPCEQTRFGVDKPDWPHPTTLGWTGTRTESQALTPNTSYRMLFSLGEQLICSSMFHNITSKQSGCGCNDIFTNHIWMKRSGTYFWPCSLCQHQAVYICPFVLVNAYQTQQIEWTHKGIQWIQDFVNYSISKKGIFFFYIQQGASFCTVWGMLHRPVQCQILPTASVAIHFSVK